MMDHLAVQLALRDRLLSVVVSTTGTTTLSRTATGFSRDAGSFLADGFVPGMEVVPAGFADNRVSVIREVTALTMAVDDPAPAEAAAPGRSLTVGIPVIQGWENREMREIDGRWYIDEDFLPGSKESIGGSRVVLHWPIYVVRLIGLAGTGLSAISKVADSILAIFPPKYEITVDAQTMLRVRSDAAPSRGQIASRSAGQAEVTITIPLWAQTVSPL